MSETIPMFEGEEFAPAPVPAKKARLTVRKRAIELRDRCLEATRTAATDDTIVVGDRIYWVVPLLDVLKHIGVPGCECT
jgi:hypothetical protein